MAAEYATVRWSSIQLMTFQTTKWCVVLDLSHVATLVVGMCFRLLMQIGMTWSVPSSSFRVNRNAVLLLPGGTWTSIVQQCAQWSLWTAPSSKRVARLPCHRYDKMSSYAWPCSCYMVLLRVHSLWKLTCQSSGAFVGVGCLNFDFLSQLRMFQQYCKVFISPGIKGILQFNGLFVASWSLWFSIDCFAYKINSFVPLVVCARR